MWNKVLPWIGGIFAAVGLILIFYEVILSIKRRNKTKTNIAGLVLLAAAVIGYVCTDIIFTDSVWPPIASLIWIAMFWAYVIIDACVTFGAVRKVHRDKKAAAALAKSSDEQPDEQEHTTTATDDNANEVVTTEAEQPSDAPAKKTKRKQ